MPDEQLTPHFALSEFLKSEYASRHGIDMTPSEQIKGELLALCEHILEPLRIHLGKPVIVTSGYRPPALNAAIGGARDSRHQYGRAADIHVPGMTPLQVCQTIYALKLPFEQLIHEFAAWCHVAVMPETGGNPETLTAVHINGRTVYESGLREIAA